MLKKIKEFGKNTIIYGAGNVLNKILTFLLIPLYNNYIPVSDFGVLAIFEISILFLSNIFGYGIQAGHQRYFFIEKENGTYKTFLFNTFFGNSVLTLLSIIPFLFLSGSITNWLQLNPTQQINVQLMFWIIISEILYIFPLQILQYENKPYSYMILNFTKLAISFLLTWYFVKFEGLGIYGIMSARLLGGSSVLLVAILSIIIPRCIFKFNTEMLLRSLKFGLPIMISALGYSLFLVNDRYMLKFLSNDTETGKYSFGYKISNFINLIFVQTIGTSFFPSIFSSEADKNNKRYYRKMLTYYCLLMAIAILAFLFLYKDFLTLVVTNKDYWQGLSIVPILGLSFMILGMNYFLGIGLYLKNRTILYIIPSLVTLFTSIGLNYLWIPTYGMMGAAYSTLLSQIIYTGILALLSEKQLYICFEWRKILIIYTLSIAIFYVVFYLNIQNIWLRWFIESTVIIAIPILLYWINFFDKTENAQIKALISKFFKND